MPPKARITKAMIVEEAYEIARAEGVEKITARAVSERLGCSTQPVLYYFATVDEIKAAVYQRANEYHTRRLMDMAQDCEDPMLAIGMNYVRFAVEERNLFRLLFQSNCFSGAGFIELVQSEELQPIMGILPQETGVSAQKAQQIFTIICVFVHGYASMLANNEMAYDEKALASLLNQVFIGAVYAAKEIKDEEAL